MITNIQEIYKFKIIILGYSSMKLALHLFKESQVFSLLKELNKNQLSNNLLLDIMSRESFLENNLGNTIVIMKIIIFAGSSQTIFLMVI